MNEEILQPAPLWVRLAARLIRRLPAGRYRMTHQIRFRPPPFLMRLPSELGSYVFICDLRDSIVREVCFTGRYEPQETSLVQAILQPGMSFVDVGANWGYFTLLAAFRVGKNGRVISLEPDPRLFSILEENLARNNLNQVTALPLAAADSKRTLTLAGYEERCGNFGVSRISARSLSKNGHFQVSANSLDAILEEQKLESVDLLKMDIEGGEAFAIKGLEKSLNEGRIKCLLLELHPGYLLEHQSSLEAITKFLVAAHYSGFTIDYSPSVNRLSAYGRIHNPWTLIRRFDLSEPLDAWPHQLWVAPSSKPAWLPCCESSQSYVK